ncbi:hypothetical protein [Krasilnikovia sp. M28-CT-15]|uniref:hypothetical protein n=1 Tax=Krasilnikovia sp. M28-CT-15 TaxID=3373540 RepID=UPI00387616C1
MAYLFPPMAEEPPRDYVDFVAGHLDALRRDAARLVDGDPYATQLPGEVLADVAGHWRRLRWWSRLRRDDAAAEFLARRLVSRTKEWREERLSPVEVCPVPQPGAVPPLPPAVGRAPGCGGVTTASATRPVSVAQGLAPLLGSTVRAGARPVAEAGIAWVHAYQRYCRRRVGRLAAAVVLIVSGIVQLMSHWSTTAT